MTTHSSFLAWRISWTEEPGGLQSIGSQRIGHNWLTTTTDSPKNLEVKNQIFFSFYCRMYMCMYVYVYMYICRHTHNVLEKNPFISLINLLKTGKLKERGQVGTFWSCLTFLLHAWNGTSKKHGVLGPEVPSRSKDKLFSLVRKPGPRKVKWLPQSTQPDGRRAEKTYIDSSKTTPQRTGL